MKKVILILFLLISCVTLNAEQIAKTYTVNKLDTGFSGYSIKWEDVDVDINKMIEKGWKVFSITPLTTYDKIGPMNSASRTCKILVIYER